MRLLLDTHVFLWYLTQSRRLSDDMRIAISDLDNQVFLSVVSIWEAVIKHDLGKLPQVMSPADELPRYRIAHGIESLTIDESVMVWLARLPSIHRDPFDRLLVAQALQNGLTLVTLDKAIRAYPVQVLPA